MLARRNPVEAGIASSSCSRTPRNDDSTWIAEPVPSPSIMLRPSALRLRLEEINSAKDRLTPRNDVHKLMALSGPPAKWGKVLSVTVM